MRSHQRGCGRWSPERSGRPRGRGEEAVVHQSVCDGWQIAPDVVDICGRTWADTFGESPGRTTEGVACPKCALEATP